MNPDNSIIRNTEDSGIHNTLLAAIRGADMDKILDEDGPFTVFAPSDVAFQKLPQGKLTSLLSPANKKELYAVLTYHIVAGNLSASKILRAMVKGNGTATFTTIQGDKLKASMRGIDIVLTDNFGNTAKIINADSNQCNGVIHEIDSVIMPKKI